jgi:hypothetical protein
MKKTATGSIQTVRHDFFYRNLIKIHKVTEVTILSLLLDL